MVGSLSCLRLALNSSAVGCVIGTISLGLGGQQAIEASQVRDRHAHGGECAGGDWQRGGTCWPGGAPGRPLVAAPGPPPGGAPPPARRASRPARREAAPPP